ASPRSAHSVGSPSSGTYIARANPHTAACDRSAQRASAPDHHGAGLACRGGGDRALPHSRLQRSVDRLTAPRQRALVGRYSDSARDRAPSSSVRHWAAVLARRGCVDLALPRLRRRWTCYRNLTAPLSSLRTSDLP